MGTEKNKPEKLDGLHNVDTANISDFGIKYLDMYFGGSCNLNCLYCFTNHNKGSLTTDDRKYILRQGKNLSVESFVATGAGEPMLDSGFRAVVSCANELGMKSVIYTNGHCIDREMASYLYNNNVSLALKLESLDENVQDKITGRKGSHEDSLRAMDNLLNVGYGEVDSEGVSRLGVAAVYTALNIEGFSALKKYCENRGVLFMADELGLEKEAGKNREELFVPKSKIDLVKSNLRIVESGVGSPHSNSNATCNFADYGIRLDQDGNVSYCTMQDLGDIVGRVPDITLREAVRSTRIAKLIAIRERGKALDQVNDALSRANAGCEVKLPIGTCPFKAGYNLQVIVGGENE